MRASIVGLCLAAGLLAKGGPAEAELGLEAKALLQEGVRLHDEGHYDEAIATYRRALALAPGGPELIYEISFSLQSAGRFQECAENAEPHLKKSGPLKAAFYSVIGSCIDSAGDPKRAAKMVDKALKEFPEAGVLAFNAGITRLRTQEPAKAKELLKKFVRQQPGHRSSHLQLALAFEQGGYRIQSFLAQVRFLSLGHDDPRALEAAQRVLGLMGGGLTQTGEKEYKITLSTGRPQDEGDYGPAELVMSLGAAVVTTEEWAAKSEGEKLVYRVDSVLATLEEGPDEEKPDFARATYLPFTRELRRAGLLESFVYDYFAPAGVSGMREWLAAHPEDQAKLRDFLERRAPG